jgi:hypothetical protein
MWKRIAAVGAAAVIIGGAGTAAFAASGTTTPSPTAASISPVSDISTNTATNTAAIGSHLAVDRLRRAVHATWVTKNKKTGVFTTHDVIRGLVTAVSATSITVQAADNVTETYVINGRTKVYTRALKSAASKTAALISDVKTRDLVRVGGTGTTTLTALRVVDIKK